MAETSNSPAVETPNAEFDPWPLINALFGRIRMIIGFVLLAGLLGLLYLSFQVPQYTATALIQLNVKEQPVLDTQTMTFRNDDDSALQSQIDILKSPTFVRRIVEKLELDTKPEFNEALQPKTFVAGVKNGLKAFLGQDTASSDADKAEEEIAMIKVTRSVMSRIDVNKAPLSYSVRISFTSRVPSRAKNIADEIAVEFLKYQIESFADDSREANAFFEARVEELRKEVFESERAVQEFSQKHGLFELDGKTIDDQQLSELNTQLVQARTDLAQAEARLSRARQLLKSASGIDSVREVLNSGLIQALREKEAELLRQRSELSGHFGPQHPRMQNINGEIRDLQSKIDAENRKIVQGLENELQISRVRVNTLTRELNAIRGRQGSSSELEVELAELQREAQANRSLYENFLSRMKQTGEAETLEQTSAKIISEAELPLTPSAPKKKLIMILFLLGGGSIGVVLALAMEHFSLGYLSPKMIEDQTGLSCLGMLPEFEGRQSLVDYAMEHPNSVYTEALRSIMAGLQFNEDKAPRSVLILSSLPQEGKGWLSSSLAHIVADSKRKILLLDCDLHRPKISDGFAGECEKTLNDYLNGEARIEEIITLDTKSGLYYISSEPAKKNVQALLESDAMQALIAHAHEHFDTTIVDCPPVIGLSDTLFLSRLVDSALLVVRWNKTPRNVVKNALKILRRAKIPLSGIVLTRIDLDEYKRQEFGSSYNYSQYSEYYRDEAPRAGLTDKLKKLGGRG